MLVVEIAGDNPLKNISRQGSDLGRICDATEGLTSGIVGSFCPQRKLFQKEKSWINK